MREVYLSFFMFISFTLRYDKNCPRKQTVIVVCITIIHDYFKLKFIVATMSTDDHYFQSKVRKNAGTTQVMYQCNNNHWECITYRVMQAIFHIRTVIIPQLISIAHSLVCVCVKLIFFFLIHC